MRIFILCLFLNPIFSCTMMDPGTDTDQDPGENEEIDTIGQNLYFPPLDEDIWASSNLDILGWDMEKVQDLYQLLESNGTRAFIILVNGKLVLEKYFGKDLLNLTDFNKEKQWYWASAGKTLTAFIVGKAQEQNYLDITNPSSDYLGQGWTSLPSDKEINITVRNQLTMTTGLDDLVVNSNSIEPGDLIFKADAGNRWAYHNAPYTLLDAVVESAVNSEFEDYFNSILRDAIGMDGTWQWIGDNHVYLSTARAMARFGLLIQSQGKWEDIEIMKDKSFFDEMINPSQKINESYGYLWWLNGYSSHMLPATQIVFPGSISPEAPTDMISGIGKNGQYLSIIPSLNMVMVRMGENPDQVAVPILFQNDIWKIMNEILR
ncbi:MAG: beta-lactamase family protein [Saprospiraceae bacterium]|nr:beta-lactamase family protein [Bacteroidia bacterium]NNK90186.1 beta-lactamase family protein [Saprospiraceae bacterium]